jgi:hypothetical protein
MNDTKPAIASAAVWGTILVGLSTGLSLAGVRIDGLDDPKLALDIATLIGAALALFGRFRANKVISGWFK